MRGFGGLLLMIGLGQAIFQASVWLRSGYWPNFTLGDMLAELGVAFGHLALGRGARVLDWTLTAELSLTMIALGFVMALVPPLRRAYDSLHAMRMIRGTRRELSGRGGFADPLASRH